MDITITFGAWMIPAIITIIAFGWAFTVEGKSSGIGAGIQTLICLAPASLISMFAWMIYAFCK
jgi:hypothetical protein